MKYVGIHDMKEVQLEGVLDRTSSILKEKYNLSLENMYVPLTVVAAFMEAATEDRSGSIYGKRETVKTAERDLLRFSTGDILQPFPVTFDFNVQADNPLLAVAEHLRDPNREAIGTEVFDFDSLEKHYPKFYQDSHRFTLRQFIRAIEDRMIDSDDGFMGHMLRGSHVIHPGNLDLEWIEEHESELIEMQGRRGRIHVIWYNR